MNQQTMHLEIKAEDMPNYFSSERCPITMALQRAGFKGWTDAGVGIKDHNKKLIANGAAGVDAILTISDSYINLREKVQDMFSGRRTSMDFEWDLIINLPENQKPYEPSI